MSAEEIIKNLDQILKIPQNQQTPEVLQVLKDKRKQWADLFFDQSKPKEEKIAIQDNLAKLHVYFGYKEIRKIGAGKGGGGSPYIATVEQRAANCDAFINFCKAHNITDEAALRALAHVWGPVK